MLVARPSFVSRIDLTVKPQVSRPDVYTVSVERLDQTANVKVKSNAIAITVID
jgi:hypothetical protein